MPPDNQGVPDTTPPAPWPAPADLAGPDPESPAEHATPGPVSPAGAQLPPAAPTSAGWSPENGLVIWLATLVVFGVGGLIAGQQELAALVALAGLFVAAQAADLDRRWLGLYHALTWVVPVGAAATFAATAVLIAQSDLGFTARAALIALSVVSGLACLATLSRPVSDPLTRVLLRTDAPSHSLRLAARLILAGLLLAVPGWFAFRGVIESLMQNSDQFLDQLPLGGGLVGYVLVALAAVGFLLRRDLPASLERLGLKALRWRDLAVAALGIAVLFGLDVGADHLQNRFFHSLWEGDQRFNEALAGGLKPAQIVLLGLSAGVGEEITLRGALQPRLGLVLTSLLFASLHVQYSWFGMIAIFILGMVLGIIRQRTSTSVAMLVHALYDMLAVVTIGK